MRLQDWHQFENRIFTSRRVGQYAAVLLFGYVVFMVKGFTNQLWLTAEGGHSQGTDFIATWAAARLALAGQAASAYDIATFTREQLIGVAKDNGYSWAYPPTYFLLIAPLALFSYAAATLIWLFTTLAAYAVAAYAILPRKATIFAALVSPFVLWNFFAGQNAFLTAALIGGTLVLLDRKPIVAGILLGLLTVKPQLGILFPLILILTFRWQAFVAAAVTTVLLGLASLLIFGMESWTAFFAAMQTQAGTVLDRGEVAFSKQQSVHALVRLLGGGDGFAWALHIAAALAATGFSCWLWLRPFDYRLKAASLVAAVLIATPYLFSYDLPILTVPLVFLASLGIAPNGQGGGFIPGERTVIAVLVPVLLLFPGQPIGVPVLALLMLLIVLRLRMQPSR